MNGKDIEILQYEVHNLKEENSILKAELNKSKEAELDEPFFFFEMMTKRFLTTWKLLICVCKTTLKDALCSLSFSATTSHTIETVSTFVAKNLDTDSECTVQLLVELLLPLSKFYLLFIKLKPLIIWPDRNSLRKTMPMVFRKHYPQCVLIIDCFEIFWTAQLVY